MFFLFIRHFLSKSKGSYSIAESRKLWIFGDVWHEGCFACVVCWIIYNYIDTLKYQKHMFDKRFFNTHSSERRTGNTQSQKSQTKPNETTHETNLTKRHFRNRPSLLLPDVSALRSAPEFYEAQLPPAPNWDSEPLVGLQAHVIFFSGWGGWLAG